MSVFLLFPASEWLEFYYSSRLHAEIGTFLSSRACCWQCAVESPSLVCIFVFVSESSINTSTAVFSPFP